MRIVAAAFLLLSSSVFAQSAPPATPASSTAPLTISSEAAGDAGPLAVTRLSFRFELPADLSPDGELTLQGSILRGDSVVKNFRYSRRPDEQGVLRTLEKLEPGNYTVEAKLVMPQEDGAPVILAKGSLPLVAALSGQTYVATGDDGAAGVLAEGVVPESSGSVRIVPPRRDLAPNLFIVNVEVKDPVTRVEFYVEGKKILTKNAPPYRAELDLGKLPRRVEVRAVGYDRSGRYIDADAWLVNEREAPLEVKITRTITPDGVAHFKVSVQNPKSVALKSLELFAGDRKLIGWSHPPYALDIPVTRLEGVDFVRATALDINGVEATDLFYLNGQRYTEQIEVNLVELPVSVSDAAGATITDMKQGEFQILEEGKPQKIANFAFANNLPLSVGVLVDHSGSMKPRIETARAAALEFFRQIIGPRDRAFFGGFSWQSTKLSPFASTLPMLESQVSNMPQAEGATALYDAIVTALYHFRGVEGRKALVIVTDGDDTASRIDYNDMLTYARSARVPLYFIGIGISPMGGGSKMKTLAAETGAVALFVRNVDELKETYKKLENDLRSQYLISYYAEAAGKEGKYRTVEVKTTRSGARVRTIRGYIP
jgi:Ca-activated chloride channel family protein